MATYYFKVETGEPFTANAVTGEDAVAKGQAVKATNAPDNTESWRMTYNFSTNAVDVYADGKDEAGAQEQKAADNKAEDDANKAATDERAAAAKADA
tara:strand:+ start:3043 stop:3333 length:291 start_codon:yes stop_codon:yes gene_type:complete